jgi:FAD/FMN-containing dehydrogenase
MEAVMAETHLDTSHWQKLFQGQLLLQSDNEYNSVRRIWNGMIDKKPALIVRCASPADVRSAVKLARKERMTISVRGGGTELPETPFVMAGLCWISRP